MLKRLFGGILTLLVLVLSTVVVPYYASANQLQSSNYKLDEAVIGVGDLNEANSANYQAVNATGDIAIGNSTGTNYQIEAGSKTTPDPALSFSINSGSVDFGSFTATSPTFTTATFSVTNYTSYGYVVHIIGNAPTNGSHTIDSMSSNDISRSGIEQFGINLVANNTPVVIGANPDNGQFGFGSASSNYGTANNFRYVSGESIALAPKSSGKTIYTISYLVNVSSLTPGGQYNSNQTIIVTGTY